MRATISNLIGQVFEKLHLVPLRLGGVDGIVAGVISGYVPITPHRIDRGDPVPPYDEQVCDMFRTEMPGNREHFLPPGHSLEDSVAHEIVKSYQPESLDLRAGVVARGFRT